MLAKSLFILRCAECALYIVAGIVIVRAGVLSFWVYVVAALSFAVFARLALIVFTFAFTRAMSATREPQHKLTLWDKAILLMKETFAFIALFVVLQPLEPWLMRDARVFRDSGQNVAVVFVHGIYCNAAVWWWLRRRLLRRGVRNLYAINLEPLFASIDDFALQLERALVGLRETVKSERVVLVTHSMGGLVGRAYLQRVGANALVTKLISLAGPHHGSVLAKLAVGVNGRQMRPGNEWLMQLERNEGGAIALPTVSIFSCHDNFVAPQTSGELDGAENVTLSEIGHLSMLFSSEVERRIVEEISEPTDAFRA